MRSVGAAPSVGSLWISRVMGGRARPDRLGELAVDDDLLGAAGGLHAHGLLVERAGSRRGSPPGRWREERAPTRADASEMDMKVRRAEPGSGQARRRSSMLPLTDFTFERAAARADAPRHLLGPPLPLHLEPEVGLDAAVDGAALDLGAGRGGQLDGDRAVDGLEARGRRSSRCGPCWR